MKFGRLPDASGGMGTPLGCGSDRAAHRRHNRDRVVLESLNRWLACEQGHYQRLQHS
jgi:hypothetical protein